MKIISMSLELYILTTLGMCYLKDEGSIKGGMELLEFGVSKAVNSSWPKRNQGPNYFPIVNLTYDPFYFHKQSRQSDR